MTDVYQVSAHPTFDNGVPASVSAGSRVHLSGATRPDEEGDVMVYPESGDPADWNYVALSCLTPTPDVERVSVKAVRALLAMSDMPASDIDDFVRMVSIVDTAYLS